MLVCVATQSLVLPSLIFLTCCTFYSEVPSRTLRSLSDTHVQTRSNASVVNFMAFVLSHTSVLIPHILTSRLTSPKTLGLVVLNSLFLQSEQVQGISLQLTTLLSLSLSLSPEWHHSGGPPMPPFPYPFPWHFNPYNPWPPHHSYVQQPRSQTVNDDRCSVASSRLI